MYRIKTNGNVNLVIGDIKVSISAAQVGGILVDKSKIDNSKDAQKLIAAKLLIVEEDGKAVAEKKEAKVGTKKDAIFVTEGSVTTNPSDVFVRNPEKPTKEAKIETVSSKTTEAADEIKAPAIVAEPAATVNVVEEGPISSSVEVAVTQEQEAVDTSAEVEESTTNKKSHPGKGRRQ